MAGILNLQLKVLMGEKEKNLKKVEHYIKFNSDKKLDLVVLPEFFSTSTDYEKEPEDENGGKTIEFVRNLAKKYNTNVIAGTVVRNVGEKLYNTCFAIDRAGEIIAAYDKIHLYNYMGGNEGESISAGEKIAVAHFDFARVGMAICFDIRYPLHFNKLLKEGVQIITLPTAWLVPDMIYTNANDLRYAQEMWVSINRTRAYDNEVFWIVSNHTKQSGNGFGGVGNSMIISPTAQILANAYNDECAIYADIDVSNAKYMQQLFPLNRLD